MRARGDDFAAGAEFSRRRRSGPLSASIQLRRLCRTDNGPEAGLQFLNARPSALAAGGLVNDRELGAALALVSNGNILVAGGIQ